MNDIIASNPGCFGVAMQDAARWMSQSSPWGIGASAGILLIALTAALGRRKKPVKWMPITARIIGCKVAVIYGWFFRSEKTVRTHYRYCYEVNGTSYQSSTSVTEYRDPYFSAREHARKIVTAGELRVYYNRRKPAITVLTLPKSHDVGAA